MDHCIAISTYPGHRGDNFFGRVVRQLGLVVRRPSGCLPWSRPEGRCEARARWAPPSERIFAEGRASSPAEAPIDHQKATAGGDGSETTGLELARRVSAAVHRGNARAMLRRLRWRRGRFGPNADRCFALGEAVGSPSSSSTRLAEYIRAPPGLAEQSHLCATMTQLSRLRASLRSFRFVRGLRGR